MMAELDERYKHDMGILLKFEKKFQDDFYKSFTQAAKKYKKDIVDILNAQAFLLDSKLWQEAKTSKAIKAHFHKAGINGEFNTKTYLKYYLDTQDASKLTDDNKKLFELYKYLSKLQIDQVMIIVSNAEDAIEYESSINKIEAICGIKSFINEKKALKWAMRNSIKVLIVEDELARMKVDRFLKYYKKYVLVIPKIILLGATIKSDEYKIDISLPNSISPKVVAQNVEQLLNK
jgi:hypothetical protein